MTGQHPRVYPNVRARLRRRKNAPGAPPAETSMVIWLSGQRFRVRDETGRAYAEIVADVTAARGFGMTPRTMEEFMDAWHASRHPSHRKPTELFGDWETGEAVVYEQYHEPWAARLAVVGLVGEQVLTDGREAAFDSVGESVYLGHRCQEYRFAIEGDEDGIAYRSDVRWLVWSPYVLLREVRDTPHGGLHALTEVVELAQGAVTEADLRPGEQKT
jgi:hypothetical protein